MKDILTSFSTRETPQNQQADSRQKKNNAGGYTFEVSNLERLKRFLTLGSSSGTYYVGAGELTRQNAEVVVEMAKTEHKVLVDTIVNISRRGAAPKNDYALFALAIAASIGTEDQKRDALSVLNYVARTGTHLFQFVTYIQQFRGWGRGLRRAVGNWYTAKSPDSAAFQAVKYRQRNGWTHRDVLRKAHVETISPEMKSLFNWITKNVHDGQTPKIVEGFMKAQEHDAKIPELISRYGLSWEMLPTEALNEASTWSMLLDMNLLPQNALIRQLPRLTRLGLLPEIGGYTDDVSRKLQDSLRLKKARVHPVNVLNAQRTYSQGHSFRGSSTWEPTQHIVDSLDAAFYNAFGGVEAANKKTLLALDVSGSMSWGGINGIALTPREASAALSLVQLATEQQAAVVGFTGYDDVSPLRISPRQRLDDVIRTVSDLPFGPTDCSLPIEYALKRNLDIETFVIYTDSETWAGRSHPHQALKNYREKTGIDAKMVVVGMTATDATIADPSDPGMLDIAGFDAAVPNLITEFSKGL